MKYQCVDYVTALENRDGSDDIDCQSVIDQENENLTEQSHVKDADINNIVRKYEQTGIIDPFLVREGAGYYGDFTQHRDFQENLNTVIAAQDAFAALPARVRALYDNDPAKLMKHLDFIHANPTEENIGLGIKNGILDKRHAEPKEETTPAPVGNAGGVSPQTPPKVV